MATEVIRPRRHPQEWGRGPNHRELWLRDRDGYKVVLASPDGTTDVRCSVRIRSDRG